jgi:hypothetical protein
MTLSNVSTEDFEITPWWTQRSHYDFSQRFNRRFKDHPMMNSKATLWLCPTFQQKISRSRRDELKGHIMTLANVSTEDLKITPWWIQRSHYDFADVSTEDLKITPWWTWRSHYDFVQRFNRRFKDYAMINSKVTLWLCPRFQQRI